MAEFIFKRIRSDRPENYECAVCLAKSPIVVGAVVLRDDSAGIYVCEKCAKQSPAMCLQSFDWQIKHAQSQIAQWNRHVKTVEFYRALFARARSWDVDLGEVETPWPTRKAIFN